MVCVLTQGQEDGVHLDRLCLVCKVNKACRGILPTFADVILGLAMTQFFRKHVEDEYHFLFDYPVYSSIRASHASLSARCKANACDGFIKVVIGAVS